MYNNFEISLVVFIPNITTNHAITYTNQTNHSDQSNPKYYALHKEAGFSSWKKPILPKCLIRPLSGRPVLTFGKGPQSHN